MVGKGEGYRSEIADRPGGRILLQQETVTLLPRSHRFDNLLHEHKIVESIPYHRKILPCQSYLLILLMLMEGGATDKNLR